MGRQESNISFPFPTLSLQVFKPEGDKSRGRGESVRGDRTGTEDVHRLGSECLMGKL